MICSNCGKENKDNARFCSFCGHIFANEASPQQPTPDQTPDNLIPDPEPSNSASVEEEPVQPTRTEDVIFVNGRQYRRRILICAVVALAVLVVLVVFFIVRPDKPAISETTDPVTTQETVTTQELTATESAAEESTTRKPATTEASKEEVTTQEPTTSEAETDDQLA